MSLKFESMRILRIIISIASILLLIGFFRWTGLKGLMSFILGLFVMAYLLLSKNAMLMGVVEYFEAGRKY